MTNFSKLLKKQNDTSVLDQPGAFLEDDVVRSLDMQEALRLAAKDAGLTDDLIDALYPLSDVGKIV
jgi:hypothetical protein